MAAKDMLQVLPNGMILDNQAGLVVIPANQHEPGCPARPIDNVRYGTRRYTDGVLVTVTECLHCSAHRVDS